jgi:hypothetical protein
VFFAAIMMFIAGTAQFFAGLAAVLGNVPYAFTAGNQLLDFRPVHLGLDPPAGWAGGGRGRGRVAGGPAVGRVIAIIVVLLSAVTNFLFIPRYPFWALTIMLWTSW